MKKMICFLIALVAVGLLSGCAVEEAALAPVTHTPEWIETAAVPELPEPAVLIHMDLTKSMRGFSGWEDSAISRTLLELTNQARFNSRWSTYLLEPDNDRDLQWEACNPLLVTAAMINVKDESSYTMSGDFDDGGPVYSLFHRQADPQQVYVLITDLLEQEGQLNTIYAYTEQLFRADSHEQLYIAIANSEYSGRVSFPKIEGEKIIITGCDFEGERPFAVIAAGPKAGVQEFRRVLLDTEVDFKEFLVENRRDSGIRLDLELAHILDRNILIEDMAQAHCTIDLAHMEALEGGFVYSKVSANHSHSAQLALHALVDPKLELRMEGQRWLSWQQHSVTGEPEQTQDTAPTEPLEQWGWVACDLPEGVTVGLSQVESGNAIAGHTAEHSGLEDIAVPDDRVLQELRVHLDEQTSGKAYAFQADLVAQVSNPLASTAPFADWDISFSLYGKAVEDPSVLQRIPDLELFLNALIGLDAAENQDTVGRIRLVIQNYS